MTQSPTFSCKHFVKFTGGSNLREWIRNCIDLQLLLSIARHKTAVFDKNSLRSFWKWRAVISASLNQGLSIQVWRWYVHFNDNKKIIIHLVWKWYYWYLEGRSAHIWISGYSLMYKKHHLYWFVVVLCPHLSLSSKTLIAESVTSRFSFYPGYETTVGLGNYIKHAVVTTVQPGLLYTCLSQNLGYMYVDLSLCELVSNCKLLFNVNVAGACCCHCMLFPCFV